MENKQIAQEALPTIDDNSIVLKVTDDNLTKLDKAFNHESVKGLLTSVLIDTRISVETFLTQMKLAVKANPKLADIISDFKIQKSYDEIAKKWIEKKTPNNQQESFKSFIACAMKSAVLGYVLDGKDASAAPFWSNQNNKFDVVFVEGIHGIKRKFKEKKLRLEWVTIYAHMQVVKTWDSDKEKMKLEIQGINDEVDYKFSKDMTLNEQKKNIKGFYLVARSIDTEKVIDSKYITLDKVWNTIMSSKSLAYYSEDTLVADKADKQKNIKESTVWHEYFETMVLKSIIKKFIRDTAILSYDEMFGNQAVIREAEGDDYLLQEQLQNQINQLQLQLSDLQIQQPIVANLVETPDEDSMGWDEDSDNPQPDWDKFKTELDQDINNQNELALNEVK
jgi:hypothetical protein